MPPYASIEISLSNFHLGSNDGTVLTMSDLPEDSGIDIGELSFHDVEMLKTQDPFMYASIEQELRKRKCCNFDSAPEDDVGNEGVSRGLDAPDAAACFSREDTINEETGTIQTSTQGSSTQASDLQQRVLSSARQQRGKSQSVRVSSTSSDCQKRRFSQSFSGFSTGVVTRKRRIFAETYYDDEMMELAASVRSSMTSEVINLSRLMIGQNNNEDKGATDGLDLSFFD